MGFLNNLIENNTAQILYSIIIETFRLISLNPCQYILEQRNRITVVVVYSFSMHKKRHTMTSVKAEQCETTVYAYCA